MKIRRRQVGGRYLGWVRGAFTRGPNKSTANVKVPKMVRAA